MVLYVSSHTIGRQDMSKSRPSFSDFLAAPYDPNLEQELFNRIMLPNGTVKTTSAHRLDDVNRWVMPYIQRMQNRPVDIMDVAASSGVSTQEWDDYLSGSGVAAKIVGTDISVDVLHLRGFLLEAVLDKKLNVIHLAMMNRGMPPKARFPLSLVTALGKLGVRTKFAFGQKTGPVRLVSKSVRTVKIVEDDLLDENDAVSGVFDVIRVANLLNLAYFKSDILKAMMRMLRRRLRREGLLIVCRTHKDGSNHATLFRVDEDSWRPLARLGGGSEIESIF